MIYSERLKRYKDVLEKRSIGLSFAEIAKGYNVTQQAISKFFKKGKPKQHQRSLKTKPDFITLEQWINLPKNGRDRNREKIRIRDNYTCQDCDKLWEVGTRRFDIHHLDGLCGKKSKGYDKLSDKNKFVTLCHSCHFNRPEHKLNNKINN